MPEAPPRRRLRILGVLGFLSWLHLYVGALFAIGVVVGFGPSVAMWLRILDDDTEPTRLERPFPWLLALVAAALPLPAVRGRSWKYASLATIPLVLVPIWHLVVLLRLRPPR